MKIDTERDDAFKTNFEGTKSYTIKTGAKAFAVLSSQLYKNPIRAIIRELSCNAMDAHRVAGNAEPFKVYFPNPFSDEFAVEDRGVGMSPEEMEKVYHTYFESTKEDSDEDIGGFGIGSKTPFSYTSMFNVRSVKDGVETVSMSFLDAEKIPKYNLIRTGKTSDPNGTRVSFSVKKGDYEKFYREAVAVFAFLPYVPKIESGKEEVQEYLPRVDRRQEWSDYEVIRASIVQGKPTHEAAELVNDVVGGACFLMGGVPYRFDAFEVFKNDEGIDGDQFKARHIRNFFKIKIVTPVNIGDVVVQPSREELSYETRTIETAKRKFGESFKSFFDELLAARTLYEKVAACFKNCEQLKFLSDYGFSLGKHSIGGDYPKISIPDLKNVFNVDVFTDVVAETLCELITDATKFNDALNGLVVRFKNKLVNIDTINNFHVPILQIWQNGKMKVAGGQVIAPKYRWHKTWTVSELYKAIDSEWVVTCSKEFWDSYFRNEPLNVDRKEWHNTKKVVLERTETMWRKKNSEIYVVNPANAKLLKKHGFPVLPNFEAVDKFEYKIERKTSKASALKDAMVNVLFAPNKLKLTTSNYCKYGYVAAEAEKIGAKVVWVVYEPGKSYYAQSDNVLFMLPSYDKQNASKENVKAVNYDSSFLDNLADVAKKFGVATLDNLVVIGVSYLDMKRAKLYEDMSNSMQKLLEEIFHEVFDKAKTTAIKYAVSKEMNLYTQIRKVVRAKHGNLGCSEFEKILEGVEDYDSTEGDKTKYNNVVNGFIKYVASAASNVKADNWEEITNKLKKKLFEIYPMVKYRDRSSWYGCNEKFIEDCADYIIERNGLLFAEGRRVVAAATMSEEQRLQASA